MLPLRNVYIKWGNAFKYVPIYSIKACRIYAAVEIIYVIQVNTHWGWIFYRNILFIYKFACSIIGPKERVRTV